MNIFKSLDARPMPGRSAGPLAWLRANLFSSASNSVMTLVLLALGVWTLLASMDWALLHAVFGANLQACNDVRGVGACWGVITEKGRLIVMGRYPQEEH
jgi:general L-amino acid transport system permease protein